MGFPDLDLPIPLPSAPMEAKRTESIPEGDQWIYEPKWDGFRALVFRSDGEIVIQSKNQKPLTRYFPELVEAFSRVRRRGYVLDGEITIAVDGVLSFDDLLLRIHPAASSVRALAEATPAAFIAFDLLCTGHSSRSDLSSKPFEVRRQRLETYFQSASSDRIFVTPSTNDRDIASRWFRDLAEEGLDGVMAKRRELDYRFGERDGMLKVKHFRTADCVIGGYRQSGDRISLVLGLFDQDGNLRHVGHTGSLPQALAPDVLELLEG
ncbi:MAG: ATP-dependent DNA ligase, partial [Thermoanaerobaculia bacterium]|nr:ATP-dependent DNA ligase [Thermoanaerobaculia bacterium]